MISLSKNFEKEDKNEQIESKFKAYSNKKNEEKYAQLNKTHMEVIKLKRKNFTKKQKENKNKKKVDYSSSDSEDEDIKDDYVKNLRLDREIIRAFKKDKSEEFSKRIPLKRIVYLYNRLWNDDLSDDLLSDSEDSSYSY